MRSSFTEPGIRTRATRSPRDVFAHPVIDRAAQAPPLDGFVAALDLATFVALVLSMRVRPALAIALLVVFVPFALERQIGPTTISLSKVALLGALVGLALRRASFAAVGERTARTLALCGLAVLAATALSIWHATFRGAALRETLKAAEYLTLFVVVVVASRLASTDEDDRTIGIAIVGTMTLVAVLALAQEVVGAPSGMWVAGHPIPRIAGPLDGPNQLAGYLGVALCVVLALGLRGRAASGPRFAAAASIGVAALVLTLSRTGVLTGLAALVATASLSPRRPTRRELAIVLGGTVVGLGVLAVWGLSVAPGGSASRVPGIGAVIGHFSTVAEAERPGSVGTRSQLWHAAFALWRAHPFFGVGAGNFERELGLVGYPQLRTHANSLYVQSLVEGGIPLLLATLALVAASIGVFVRGPFGEPFVVGALGASLALGSHQILDLLVFYPKVGALWWIVLALGAARRDRVLARP